MPSTKVIDLHQSRRPGTLLQFIVVLRYRRLFRGTLGSGMRVFGQLLTALTLTIVLLLGVANGALAHALLTDHHASVLADLPAAADKDQHKAPCDHCPGHTDDYALSMAAPCCPGFAGPMRFPVHGLTAVQRAAWYSAAAHRPDSHLIAPELPPPKRAV